MYGDIDILAIAGQGFIDGVVHHFVYEVMQTLYTDIADIHGGALPDGFQTFQNLYTICAVTGRNLGRFFLCFRGHN